MQAHDTGPKWVGHIAQRLIRYRGFLVGAFLLITVALAWTAMQLRTDAAFTKMIPLNHPFMQVFLKYQDVFGGANRVLVSIAPRKGDIYTAETLELLRTITEEVFFIEGVEMAATQAEQGIVALASQVASDRRLLLESPKAGPSSYRLFEALPMMPRFTIEMVRQRLGTSFPTATAAVNVLDRPLLLFSAH